MNHSKNLNSVKKKHLLAASPRLSSSQKRWWRGVLRLRPDSAAQKSAPGRGALRSQSVLFHFLNRSDRKTGLPRPSASRPRNDVWGGRFFIVIAALVFSSFAQADSASATLTQLLNNIRTMQADFTQTIVNQSGQSLQQSRGQMVLVRPGKFRWEVKSPVRQLLIANGRRLWIYDPDLEQVTIRLLNKAAGELPALLLSDANVALTKDFNVRFQPDSSSLSRFYLTPKNSDSLLSRVTLVFSGGQIREMDLRDHLGHTTMIQFQRIVLNASASSSLFNFVPPANVDVIDETRR